MSYTDKEAPDPESTSFSDIFRILSNVHLHDETTDDSVTTRNNLGACEHGEPCSNTNKKRRVQELRKCLSEGNEQLTSEAKRKEEQRPKRTRSAETHNISERRRRSRINEKIRSLHQLIPKSNKKDCASILDEAVTYMKALKMQAQMMSMNMGAKYYNPYLPAAWMPNMPAAQYPPYVTFQPGIGLVPMVPMPSPMHGSPGTMLPLVQGDQMDVYQPQQPIQANDSMPSLQQTVTAIPLPHIDAKGKGPAFKESGSQEASTSAQVPPNFYPGYNVHATQVVPPSRDEQNM